MRDELRHVDAVFAALQQHIHALKGCFAQLQAIIYLVLEWTQIYLPAHTDSVCAGENWMQIGRDLLLTITICSSVVLSRRIVIACRVDVQAADAQGILGMGTDTKCCQRQPANQSGSHFVMASRSTPVACRLEKNVSSSGVIT